MKKSLKRMIILSITFLATIIPNINSNVYALTNDLHNSPVNSRFINYIADSPANKKGFIPSPMIINKTGRSIKGRYLEPILPSQYDLRELNRLTSVKNQYSSNDCWAFATYGSLESSLMPEESLDFSENNMKNKSGFDWEDGGNYDMATAYLARWDGPVLESDDRFSTESRYSPDGLKVQKHIQDVVYVPGRSNSVDNQEIKSAVLRYGVVASSLYSDIYYYDERYKSYNYNGFYMANHAIDIVGWDDNFSKDNFKIKPEGNGAFICRNSWGEEWGDKGYFYVSYYDTALAKDMGAIFLKPESNNNYDNIYQYDLLGNISNTGYGSEGAWYSNVFESKGSEALSAVSFYTNVEGARYSLYINKNFIGVESLDKSKLVRIKSGIIDMPGYHTINLDMQPNNLIPNNKFAVVIEITTPGSIYPVPIEYPYPEYSSEAKANSGESYISPDGVSWEDINLNSYGANNGENTNVCLKAFTKNVDVNILGDIDEDGVITDNDALIIKEYLLGRRNIIVLDKADVDGDGKITSSDYSYIKGRIIFD